MPSTDMPINDYSEPLSPSLHQKQWWVMKQVTDDGFEISTKKSQRAKQGVP